MGQNTPKPLKTDAKNWHLGIRCPRVANGTSALISNRAQSRVTGWFGGYYSFPWVLQWEICLNSHLFWLFPRYKPEPAPRHFLSSALG